METIMSTDPNPTENPAPSSKTSKGMMITGWVLTLLPALFMLSGAIFGLIKGDEMADDIRKMGYDPQMMPKIIAVEICCVILYLIPQTTVLGAILLTGFLGGATATHVRIHDAGFFFPVLFGIIIWFGVYFRDARLRALVPLRQK